MKSKTIVVGLLWSLATFFVVQSIYYLARAILLTWEYGPGIGTTFVHFRVLDFIVKALYSVFHLVGLGVVAFTLWFSFSDVRGLYYYIEAKLFPSAWQTEEECVRKSCNHSRPTRSLKTEDKAQRPSK
jgi:hypothetical protein